MKHTGCSEKSAHLEANERHACAAHATHVGEAAGRGEQDVGQLY